MNPKVKNALFVVAVLVGVKLAKTMLPGINQQAGDLVNKFL